jgi:hypothetical protein
MTELNEDINGSLAIFDIDDTMFRTTTRVHVVRNEKRIVSLTAAEFNVYKLNPSESFDFSEFRNAKHFADTAKPIANIFRLAKTILKRNAGRLIVVTARADMDDKQLFIDTFRKYGFNMNKSHIFRAGNINKPGAEAKKDIIRTQMTGQAYKTARMFDDARKNLDAFKELASEFSECRFEAWLIHEDGSMVRY